jgi:CRP/FNR family transcriptional regulator, polysaccharide utilization system transcription regulator
MNSFCENSDRNCLTCDEKSPIFCMLTNEELEMIRQNRSKVVFKKGETICKQGTPMSHVISVNEGLAKLYLEGVDFRHAIIRIIKPTNFIGGPGLYVDQMHHYSVTALIDTTVCFVEVGHFKTLIDQNNGFAHAFMKHYSINTLAVYNRLVNLTQKQMPGRMADTLIYLSEQVYEAQKFNLHLSKQDLADLSGMSKDSATKTLREFQHSGIINISDHELEIINPNELSRISRIG